MHSTQTYRLFCRCESTDSGRPFGKGDRDEDGDRDKDGACDEAAWAQFVDRHGTRVRHLLVRLLSRHRLRFKHYEIDDLEQDFYHRLLARTQVFRGWNDQQLWRYFEILGENLIIDRIRRLERRRGHGLRFVRLSGLSEERLEEVPSAMESPEESVLRRERQRVFFRAHLQRFVQGSRSRLKHRALILALVHGWPSREISTALEGRLSANHIDLLVHRFRRRLAQHGLRLPRRSFRPSRRSKKGPPRSGLAVVE